MQIHKQTQKEKLYKCRIYIWIESEKTSMMEKKWV